MQTCQFGFGFCLFSLVVWLPWVHKEDFLGKEKSPPSLTGYVYISVQMPNPTPAPLKQNWNAFFLLRIFAIPMASVQIKGKKLITRISLPFSQMFHKIQYFISIFQSRQPLYVALSSTTQSELQGWPCPLEIMPCICNWGVHAKLPQLCPTLRPHGLQPTRFLCPWDFPGKNIGMGCHAHLKGSSWPRDQTPVSCISCTAGQFFTR